MKSGKADVSKWQNCIVSYIDMSGVKNMLARSSKDAVRLVRRMHTKVQTASRKLTMHEEVCFWNDSVLLVGSVDAPPERYEQIMREVHTIKAVVDEVKRGYAICVKGITFPPPRAKSLTCSPGPRLIYLHASSLALSNCFLIEKRAKEKKWRRDWYIDDRIIKHIDARRPDWTDVVDLWPRSRKCELHMYNGSFFENWSETYPISGAK